ncbi:hypothetical protein [Priestia aryabhattai]
MTKQKEWPKELVFIELNSGRFEFFNIELIKLGYNNFQVVFHQGKFNNKGRNVVQRFTGEDAYLKAKKVAYNKFYNIKSEGFIRKEKMEEAILNAVKQEQKVDNEKKFKKKHNTNTHKQTKKQCVCDLCKQPIHFNLYEKINSWGRSEGNWDHSNNSPLFKKVVCLDCQIDKGIFQRRIDDSFNL